LILFLARSLILPLSAATLLSAATSAATLDPSPAGQKCQTFHYLFLGCLSSAQVGGLLRRASARQASARG
jgi:hypothetical protein